MRVPNLSIIVFSIALCASSAVENDFSLSFHGAQGIRIFCNTKEKLNLVSKYETKPGYDLIFRKPPMLEVLVASDQAEKFKVTLDENDVVYEVFVEDVAKVVRDSLEQQNQARIAASNNQDNYSISLQYYPRYAEIKSYLIQLSESHSDIASLFITGKSYEGRDIVGLKISSGGSEKPILFIDAGIHANEWMAPATALYAIKTLVENSTNRYIFKNIDIYVIPSLNPDGYEYTHQNESTRMWRKTRSRVANSECRGVDPNRNFDIEWMSHGASSNPCSYAYAGPSPFCEPETAALRDIILSLKDRIKVYLTLHTYGNLFLHPWGHTTDLPKNEPLLRCVANKAKAKLYEVRGTEYVIGSSANANTYTAGNSKDWAMGKAGIDVTYTMELPRGYGFMPPPSEILPTGYETFQAIKVLASYVEHQICQD